MNYLGEDFQLICQPRKDFDVKRSAADSDLLFALKDKIHQPYRTKLVPGLDEIIDSLKNEENVLGTVLSGAGPAILVISKDENLDKIYDTIREIWKNLNVKVDIVTLKPELQGACIVED